VALGDSLTAGHGLTPAETYPSLLQARLRAEGYLYRVVNAGVSGDTTAGALRRVDWVLRSRPDVVIVVIGANDGLRGQSIAAARANLDEIVARLQGAGARVLIGGMRLPPNYGRPYATEFERLYAEVARQRGPRSCRSSWTAWRHPSLNPTASTRRPRATASSTGSGRICAPADPLVPGQKRRQTSFSVVASPQRTPVRLDWLLLRPCLARFLTRHGVRT
jgi:hypothetical protein